MFTKMAYGNIKSIGIYLGLLLINLLGLLFMFLIGMVDFFPFFGICIACLFCMVYIKYNLKAAGFYLIFLLGQLSSLLSVFLLESNPGYIHEQGVISENVGATLWLMFYILLFFFPAFVLFSQNDFKMNIQSKSSHEIFARAFVLVCFIGLIMGLVINGSPLIMGISRFAYWNETNSISRFIFNLFPILSFSIAYLYIQQCLSGKTMCWLVGFVGVVLILYGEKFSAIYYFFTSLLIPCMFIKHEQLMKISWKKILIVLVAVITVIINVVYFHYSEQYGIDINDFLSILDFRFRLQGHVWWGAVDRNRELLSINFEQLYKELSWWFGLNLDKDIADEVGIKYLMRLVGNPALVDLYLEENVRFTMGYPAIVFSIWGGPVGGVIQLVMGTIFAYVIVFLYGAIKKRSWITSVLWFRIYMKCIDGFLMGDLLQVFSISNLIIVLLLAFISLSGKNYKCNIGLSQFEKKI